MTRWLLAAAALVFATVSLPNAFATDADAEKPVAMFPDLIDANGAEGSVHPPIGEGKWTLVMVWSTSCHICEIDKPLFSAFHEKHQDSNVTVFGISIDGHENLPSVESYLDERKVSFPNSVGEFATVSSSMIVVAEEALRGTPTYLLFDPEGEIRGVQAGHLQPERVEAFIESM